MLAHRAAQRSFSLLHRQTPSQNVLVLHHRDNLGLRLHANWGRDLASWTRSSSSISPRPTVNPILASRIRNGVQRIGTRRLSQFQLRPTGWKGRIWYKPDGTPRSKLKGLIAATLLFAAGLTTWSALSVISDLDSANYILLCLIHIQRIDMDFPSIDFTSFPSTHRHFFNLCEALFGDVPQEIVDGFLDDVWFLPEEGGVKEKAREIMREACKDVHELIYDRYGNRVGPPTGTNSTGITDGADGWETAVRVVKRLEAALMDLGELMDDTEGADEFVKLRTAKLKDIREVGERGGKGEDSYDVVG